MTDCGNMAEWLVIVPELPSCLTVAIELFEVQKTWRPGSCFQVGTWLPCGFMVFFDSAGDAHRTKWRLSFQMLPSPFSAPDLVGQDLHYSSVV